MKGDRSTFTNKRPLDAQAVAPEVRAAVGDGAVAEEVTVADGVQVGHRAQVVPAGAAAAPPLAVRSKRVPDPAHVERAGQLPLCPAGGQDPVGSALLGQQGQQQRRRQQEELHGETGEEDRKWTEVSDGADFVLWRSFTLDGRRGQGVARVAGVIRL